METAAKANEVEKIQEEFEKMKRSVKLFFYRVKGWSGILLMNFLCFLLSWFIVPTPDGTASGLLALLLIAKVLLYIGFHVLLNYLIYKALKV